MWIIGLSCLTLLDCGFLCDGLTYAQCDFSYILECLTCASICPVNRKQQWLTLASKRPARGTLSPFEVKQGGTTSWHPIIIIYFYLKTPQFPNSWSCGIFSRILQLSTRNGALPCAREHAALPGRPEAMPPTEMRFLWLVPFFFFILRWSFHCHSIIKHYTLNSHYLRSLPQALTK